jgi:hypothetical protein
VVDATLLIIQAQIDNQTTLFCIRILVVADPKCVGSALHLHLA